MPTAVIDMVEIETESNGGRFGEFNGMTSRSHVSHCKVLPPGKFNVVSHLLHFCRVEEFHPLLEIVLRHILFFVCFPNAVWASASGGFRIGSDTLEMIRAYFLNVMKTVVQKFQTVSSIACKVVTDVGLLSKSFRATSKS